MSHISDSHKGFRVPDLQKRKKAGEKISMVTCYDSAFARLVARSNIDMVLVGDSLGNVMLGMESTIPVTIDHMIHHTAAVTRVLKGPLVCADMPFLSYTSPEIALRSAGRLFQEAGAQAVKLEGGEEVCPQVKELTSHGIPVVAHLGLLPQSLNLVGGYRVQGKTQEARDKMIGDALRLQDAGACAVVFEMVPADLARLITEKLSIPTIGIGAGSGCDGQVLVLHDLLGFDADFKPKFLKKYANLATLVQESLNTYDQEVKAGTFPGPEHSF